MGADVFVRDRVADRLAAHLREDRDGRVLDDVAAVADDGGERRDLVRIDHHFADVALRLEGDGRAARAARSEDAARERGDARRKSRIDGNTLDLHAVSFFLGEDDSAEPLAGIGGSLPIVEKETARTNGAKRETDFRKSESSRENFFRFSFQEDKRDAFT